MDELSTLQSLLSRLATYQGRAAVLAFTKDHTERWTYAEIAEQAGRLATGLAKSGLSKGDPVALCAENSPRWVAACLGVVAAGGVAVPLDVQLTDDTLGHALDDSGARHVFTTERLLGRLRPLAGRSGCEPILLGGSEDGVRGWQDLCAEQADPAVVVSPEDRAVLFYTSGTTGPPKGVPLTHRNLAFQLDRLLAADLVTGDDRVLLPLPLHHVYPFTIGMLTPLALGLPIVLPHTLTGPQLMRALRDGEVTTIIGVPRLYHALFAGIQARAEGGRLRRLLFRRTLALSTALAHLKIRVGRRLFRRLHREMGPRLRVLASGGAALDPDLAWKLEGLGWLVGTGYGLTETSPLLTLDRPGQARIGSVGRPIQGVEVRIDPVALEGGRVETASRPEGQSEEGEVVARGPSVFAGYHNLPDKTEEAVTDDGWFRTGDLGYLDDDGFLYITGRVKTLIVLPGGEKLQPDEVEEAYQGSPAIREAGVLERGGKLVAVILPDRASSGQQEDPGRAGEDAVRKALEERSKALPSYQRIAEFVLTESPLPRTRLGKIRREELEELYEQIKEGRAEPAQAGPMPEEEMSPDDRALLDDPAAGKTWRWLADRFPESRITPDASPQLDLGIDSLEWLNLTLEIRQCCGVELGEEAIGRIETVRDLLREVAERPHAEGVGPEAAPLEHPEEVLGDERRRWLAPLGPAELAAARGLYTLNWMLVHAAFRLSVHGRERLPKEGPLVLAPNHESYLDSSVLAAVLDFGLLSRTYWAGWTGVAFGPIFRVLRRLAHVVPIDPDRAAASSLAFGAAVLRDRHNLVWYPEGGHSRTGELQPLKPGIGLLLEHDPVPVVPVHLDGTRDALPPGRILPRPGRIRIAFGRPLDPRELERKGRGDRPHERITSALHDEMARLGLGE
jgi:long-chain acyl-CoA synthetase